MKLKLDENLDERLADAAAQIQHPPSRKRFGATALDF